jgi:hypothetical protein
LKNYRFDGDRKLCEVASWAIWDVDIKNTKIIEQNIESLNGSIVFVGLNFGGTDDDAQKGREWGNFHCGRDSRLPKLLNNTRFKGAYMTDIIKNKATSKSKELMKKIKKREIDVNKYIKIFIKEINQLQTNDIEMYLFGNGVKSIFSDHVMKHEDFNKLKEKVKKCQRIHHYSLINPFFLKKAGVQLGLVSSKPGFKFELLW